MEWSNRLSRQLKPRDLHVLMVVVEERNMAKAAQRLSVSRPVVSKTIAALEQRLAVQLLDRLPRGVEPTIFGRALLKRASAIFDELRQSVDEVDFLKDPQAGELRVASTEVWAAALVPAALDRLSRRFSRIRVRLEQGTAKDQFNLLRERLCEVVISRLLVAAPEADIQMEPLFFEPLAIVAGPHSAWVRRRKLKLADVVEAPWILSPLECEDGSPFVETFRSARLSVPTPTIVTNSLHVRNSLLAAGQYLTLVPGSALRYGPQRRLMAVLPLRLPRWHLPTGVFSLKGRMISPVAQAFVQCVREVSQPLTRSDWQA
jgi:DNA-binding transcriptional LysR family regulator